MLEWPSVMGHKTKVAQLPGPQIQGFDRVASWPSISWLGFMVAQHSGPQNKGGPAAWATNTRV